MEKKEQAINRRTVLQRGLAFLAGMAGLEVLDRSSRLQAEPVAPPGGEPVGGPASEGVGNQVLRLFASHWKAHACGQVPGRLAVPNGRMDRHGELYDVTSGQKAGEFYATCFAPVSSFGGHGAGGVELHTFKIGVETLFGMGSSAVGSAGPQLNAILGGTGRFAGAKGSYLVSPGTARGSEGSAEIILTIIS